MSLAEKNLAQSKKIIASIGPQMDSLAAIATKIKLENVATKIREQRQALDSDTFWLIVLGRFRNGKSTFLNALLGELTHPVSHVDSNNQKVGPLPVSDLPTTAAITTINYGTSVGVTVVRSTGKNDHWTIDRFLKEGKIKRDPDENTAFYKDVVQFDMKFPSTTLQSGITLLDTPGTDDIRERTDIVTAAINKCDAAIVLLRSDVLGGEDEREYIQSLGEAGLTDLFFVVNRRDGRVVDEELKQETWYRIVNLALGGPKYAGQALESKNIYFVDAKQALDGRLTNDARKLDASGLPVFEARLSAYLEKNRRAAHVRRYVQGATNHAKAVDDAIAKMIPSLRIDAEKFRSNYQKLLPQLQEIHQRQARLPKIIDQYRETAENALLNSLRQMINDLCRDLPVELAKKKIPAVDDAVFSRLIIGFQKKKIVQQTADAAREIYQARLREWRENVPPAPGAQQALERVLDAMTEEISEQIRDIKRRFDRVQYELTGFQPDVQTGQQSADDWAKRVVAGALSILSPDYGANFLNEGGKGLLKGFLVHAGVSTLVLFLGGPVGWAFAAGMVASLIRTAVFAPEKLKESVRRQVLDALINGVPAEKIAGLRSIPDQSAPQIKTEVTKLFGDLAKAFTVAIKQEVEREEATLREQMELNTKSADEKQRLLGMMEQLRKEVATSMTSLQNGLLAIEAGSL